MLERDSPLPLYHQLKQLLAAKIRAGEWNAGDLIPGEQELQSTYALSRTTVRQALRELELDGVLTRYRGRGTFVARPKLTHDPEPDRGLASALAGHGTWLVLSSTWVAAPADVAERLQVNEGENVYHLRRLRLAGDERIGLHVAYVAPAFADAIDLGALARGRSLAYLEGHAALDSAVAERLLDAIPASEDDAGLLDAPPGSPLLRIRRLVMTRAGNPIEDCRSIYRGDRFQYHFRSGITSPSRNLD